MSPFTASTFKLLVAIQTLHRLEQTGNLEKGLETIITYTKPDGTSYALPIKRFMEAMLQWSSNDATKALIQQLHKWGDIVQGDDTNNDGFPDLEPKLNKLNALFASVGLNTLQMNRTRASTGQWGFGADNDMPYASSVSNVPQKSGFFLGYEYERAAQLNSRTMLWYFCVVFALNRLYFVANFCTRVLYIKCCC
jgi:hypothetical protein